MKKLICILFHRNFHIRDFSESNADWEHVDWAYKINKCLKCRRKWIDFDHDN